MLINIADHWYCVVDICVSLIMSIPFLLDD